MAGKHKTAEMALRESEARFRFLAENMADVVWVLDRNLQTTYVSPSIEKILGFTPEERKQQKLEEMITPESLKRVETMYMEELLRHAKDGKGPERFFSIELEYYHKDGYTVWMENRMKAIPDHSGTLDMVYGVSRDITERKHAEEQLRKYQEGLEELVDKRTKQLSQANEELRKEIIKRKNKELEIKKRKKELEEMNSALGVLLRKREADKSDLEEKLISNIKNLILPNIEKLKKITHSDQQKTYLRLIESSYKDILSPLPFRLSSKFHGLTPTEIRISSLIKNGETNKDIAKILNVSIKTIEFHRDNIRNKLGIKHKKVNLRTFLLSLH